MAETLCGSGRHTVAAFFLATGVRVEPGRRNGGAQRPQSSPGAPSRTRLAGVRPPAGARGPAWNGAPQTLRCVRLFRGDAAAIDGDGELTCGFLSFVVVAAGRCHRSKRDPVSGSMGRRRRSDHRPHSAAQAGLGWSQAVVCPVAKPCLLVVGPCETKTKAGASGRFL
jgi:hypothetical protein